LQDYTRFSAKLAELSTYMKRQRLSGMATNVQPSVSNMQQDTPKHMSFIPAALHDKVVLMSGQQWDNVDRYTLMIGQLSEMYTDLTWQEDVQWWKQHFKCTQNRIIKLLAHEEAGMIDVHDAIPKLDDTLNEMNTLSTQKIRVIILGCAMDRKFMFKAITSLLQRWGEAQQKPRKDIEMEFVTGGDLSHKLSEFCQWLCMCGICKTITFYNTMRYHPFGKCKLEFK